MRLRLDPSTSPEVWHKDNYSIPTLSTLCTRARARRNFRNYFFSREAREFIYSHLSTTRLFHNRFPCLLALSFIFYKVNEIVPPLFCQPFSFVFPRFFIFCRFCGSFFAIFAFPNKKLSTTPRMWITRFYFFRSIFPLPFLRTKKSAATEVTARKTQIQ